MENLRDRLKPGDKVILKDARDMMYDENGTFGTLLDAEDFESIADLDPYSKKLVTIKDVDEDTFEVLEKFGVNKRYYFFAGDIAVWPDEMSNLQVNMDDVLEFIGGGY